MKTPLYCSKTGYPLAELNDVLLTSIVGSRLDDLIISYSANQFLPHWLYTDTSALDNLALAFPRQTASYLLGRIFRSFAYSSNELLSETDKNTSLFRYLYTQDVLAPCYKQLEDATNEQLIELISLLSKHLEFYSEITKTQLEKQGFHSMRVINKLSVSRLINIFAVTQQQLDSHKLARQLKLQQQQERQKQLDEFDMLLSAENALPVDTFAVRTNHTKTVKRQTLSAMQCDLYEVIKDMDFTKQEQPKQEQPKQQVKKPPVTPPSSFAELLQKQLAK